MARIVYFTTMTPIGMSAVDPVFGTIRVSWNNTDVNNLFLTKVSIENNSSRDIEGLHLKVYVDDESRILGERSAIIGTSFILPWAKEYRDQIAIPDGGAPTEYQTYFYYHNREYRLDTLNRFQRVEIDLLCTRLSAQGQPNALLESKSAGVRVKRIAAPIQTRSRVLGVPVQRASLAGLLVTAVVVPASILYVEPLWLAVLIPTVIGLFAQVAGALIARTMRAIKLFFLR
jgi:hypothetical protein